MKRFFALLCLALAILPARAQFNTGTFTVTNTPHNLDSFSIGGATFTWVTAVTNPASQVLITNSIGGNATNMFLELVNYPIAGTATLTQLTNGIVSQGQAFAFAVTQLASTNGWVTLTTNSQPTTNYWAVMVPASYYPVLADATNTFSLVLAAIDTLASNSFSEGDMALANYVSKTNAQTISGNKTFSGTNGFTGSNNFGGVVMATNASNQICGSFSGNGGGVTNLNGGPYIPQNIPGAGIYYVTISNLLVFRDALGNNRLVIGTNLNLGLELYYGSGAQFITTGSNVASIYDAQGNDVVDIHDNSFIFDGNLVLNNTLSNMLCGTLYGPQLFLGTNTIAGVLCGTRFVNSSLANGNNQDVVLGTNLTTSLGGMTAAFATAGFVGGIADRFQFVVNTNSWNWTVNNDSGFESTPANRIYTGTGADVVLSSNSWALFDYDSAVSHWRLVFASGAPSSGGSGNFSGSFTGNGGGLTNVTAAGVPVVNQGTTNATTLTSFTATFTTNFMDTNYTALATGNGFALAGSYVSAKTVSNCVFNMSIATGSIDWLAVHK